MMIKAALAAIQHGQKILNGCAGIALFKKELLRRIHRRSMLNRAAAIALVGAAGYALYKFASDDD